MHAKWGEKNRITINQPSLGDECCKLYINGETNVKTDLSSLARAEKKQIMYLKTDIFLPMGAETNERMQKNRPPLRGNDKRDVRNVILTFPCRPIVPGEVGNVKKGLKQM